MFEIHIEIPGTATTENSQRNLHKVWHRSIRFDILLDLSKCKALTDRQSGPARHKGPPGHQITTKQTQQAKNFLVAVGARSASDQAAMTRLSQRS